MGLENVLAMARGAQTPVEERLDAARRDVPSRAAAAFDGATMSEIASVVRASARAVPSPRRPYDTQAYADDSDDDFVGPAGGSRSAAVVVHRRRAARRVRWLPPPSTAAARLRRRRAADPAGAASASAARLSAMARSLEADTSELSGSRSLNLSEDTDLLLRTPWTRIPREATEADANVPGECPGAGAQSTLPGSSSSGDAEAEMRASPRRPPRPWTGSRRRRRLPRPTSPPPPGARRAARQRVRRGARGRAGPPRARRGTGAQAPGRHPRRARRAGARAGRRRR